MRRGAAHGRRMLVAAALHRGGNVHGFPILRHGAPRDFDAGLAQTLHQDIVGLNVAGAFRVDQLADAMAHRLG